MVHIMGRLIRSITIIIFIIVISGALLNVACAEAAPSGSQSQQNSNDASDDLFNEIQEYIDAKTEKVVRKYELLPSFVQKVFKKEVYLITIDMTNGGTLDIKAVKKGVQLSEFIKIDDGSDVDPSIIIQMNETTVHILMNCESDRQSFEEGIKALENGTVEVEFIANKEWVANFKNYVFWLVIDRISESIND